jgi:hypothetical protein
VQWESVNVAAKSTGQYVPVNYENGNYKAHSPIGVAVSWFECNSYQLQIQGLANSSKTHITKMEDQSNFHFNKGPSPEAQVCIAGSRLRRTPQAPTKTRRPFMGRGIPARLFADMEPMLLSV